jgi:4-amino-4-deoxy-L-arabinose transferase-like glycosyltransferase
MKKYNLLNNPYLLFFPILIAFIVYVFINPTTCVGDEERYVWYAQNMIHGFYSPPAPNIILMNGPGYPILLIPFIALKLPLISMTIINAFFYYFSIIFLYKALKEIVSFRITLIFSFAWAFYYLAYQNIPRILTEPFTFFLVSILIFSTMKAFKSENKPSEKKYVLIAGIILGYIVLTKMIFGYVLMLMLIGSAILWIIYRKNLDIRKVFFISTLALLTTSPYLVYTYNLTGRIFYWGTGNDSLYWMSTPYKGEYGDWTYNLNQNPIEYGNYDIPGADSILKAHHQADFNEINKYTGIERDDAYKRIAIQNIKKHPIKFAENIVFNIGRLVFHYPFSYAVLNPRNLIIFPINGAILTFMIFSLIPTFRNWRKIPVYLKFLLIVTLLYLGGSALVSALLRMFTIIVPILFVWIAFILDRTMKINLKFK